MRKDGGGPDRTEERFADFDFIVDLGDGCEGGFREMSGLDTATQAIDYRRSRNPGFSDVEMPVIATRGHVTLKLGLIAGGERFWDWHRAVLLGRSEPRTIRIRQRDAGRRPVMTWTLAKAWPIRIIHADQTASTEEVAIESLEFGCESVAAAEG